jgi:immune inhibitor A
MPEKWSGMKITVPKGGSRRRILVALPAIALAASTLTVSGSAAAQESDTARAAVGSDDFYINYAEPAVQPDSRGAEVKGAGGIYRSGTRQGEGVRPQVRHR